MGIRILSTNRLLPVNALLASFGRTGVRRECRAIGKTYDFILLCCLRERSEILARRWEGPNFKCETAKPDRRSSGTDRETGTREAMKAGPRWSAQ